MAAEDASFFAEAFHALTGNEPFPWQEELYRRFITGRPPKVCDIPTGLGKTAIIAIWLIALANYVKSGRRSERISRRLIYVVNRRTVVDQSTNEALKIRSRLQGEGDLASKDLEVAEELRRLLRELCAADDEAVLVVSTLRGQFADNQEWSADPSRPAVICGTVDMIGSRLLFNGYRIGFKSRPLHAGFLGQDALLVHDEAHLEPAFQSLIERVEKEQREGERTGGLPWPKLGVMALSATARSGDEETHREECGRFELTEEEKQPEDPIPDPPTEPIHHAWRRLKAKKTLRLHGTPADKVAECIANLALSYKDSSAAVLIYVRTIEDVRNICSKLTDKKGGVSADRVQPLTGTMRGLERDRMADPRRPDASRVFARFLKPPKPDADEQEQWVIEPMRGAVYLVCTSAGEVGVNISADHMVCDLSAFESMVQRLGRVNRFGDGDARIDVVYPAEFDLKYPLTPAHKNSLKLLQCLPSLPSVTEPSLAHHDASPKALGELTGRSELPCRIEDAFSPSPTILDTTDI